MVGKHTQSGEFRAVFRASIRVLGVPGFELEVWLLF